MLAELKLAAAAAGMALIGVELGSASHVDGALAVMLRVRTEVLLVSNDPLRQTAVATLGERTSAATRSASCRGDLRLRACPCSQLGQCDRCPARTLL
jgi:hypothetical protein